MDINELNLNQAVVVIPEMATGPQRRAVDLLVEEVERRTAIRWPILRATDAVSVPKVVVGTEADLAMTGVSPQTGDDLLSGLDRPGAEGFRLAVAQGPHPTVLVAGHDARGVLYGVGRLLRAMAMVPGEVSIPSDLKLSTTPHARLRGHQLGYRPKNNTYDAWTPAQFERYIRELACFGANSIEILPPRTDDELTNDLMPLQPIEMMVELDRIIASYGLDVWIWYPNVGGNYRDPACVETELTERDAVFGRLPRVDHVFIPGGDPGDLSPRQLFAWSERVAEVLRRHHPRASIWLSPQAFHPARGWLDGFYAEVAREPEWLGGVVFGPWVRTPLPEMRRRVPDRYPIRHYPDITHSLQCQYPVPEWDVAFALTHGREGINPRPVAMKRIHNLYKDYAIGSITYSEGINDDVNKFVWADQDWDPDTPVIDTLRDYARLLIDPAVAAGVAQGLLALEQNWRGPVAVNGGIETTLQQWQALATHASPEVLGDYRFQMGLLRAYYDAYVRRRLLYETELEEWALDTLRRAGQVGVSHALTRATTILDAAYTSEIAQEFHVRLRAWCEQLADALNDAIGLQSSVARHGAQAWGRGAFIDGIDLPLNDGPWLRQQIREIRALDDEVIQLVAVETLLHHADPGPGGLHVDMGSPSGWVHVQGRDPAATDPGYLNSPSVGFDMAAIGDLHKTGEARIGIEAVPLSRIRQVMALYDTPLILRFEHLDRAVVSTVRGQGAFRLRVTYGSQGEDANLAANGVTLKRHGDGCRDATCTYMIPAHLIKDGTLTLIWQAKDGSRGVRVAELWLEMEFPELEAEG